MRRIEVYDKEICRYIRIVKSAEKTIEDLLSKNAELKAENTRLRERLERIVTKTDGGIG